MDKQLVEPERIGNGNGAGLSAGDGSEYPGTELRGLCEAQNYYAWIFSQFAPYLGRRVIEVGAGVGNFSGYLLNGAKDSELILVEPAANLIQVLQKRMSSEERVRVVQGYLEQLTGHLCGDTVVLVNVLEHIADDDGFLQAAHHVLQPGGTLLLFVPAVPWLHNSLDDAFRHHRRYAKSALAGKVQKAGFILEYLRYQNFPGVVSWFVAGKVLRKRTLHPVDIRLYDRWIVPWCRRLEGLWEPPIGQSLIAVARK